MPNSETQDARPGLLDGEDPPPFARDDSAQASPILVVCDHAGLRVPRRLGDLGLDGRHLQDHIGWDIGAEGVARGLGERLRATVVTGTYSRLVVDLNRAARDRSVIPAISDGVLVPGNVGLDEDTRAARLASIHDPYHATVDAALEDKHREFGCAAMIAVHSFTPRVSGIWRPWHVGVLWDKDTRIALPLLAALRAMPGLVVGDNEPYSGRHPADYTIDSHAEPHGIPYAAIEIRQDRIQSREGQAEWAERLHLALAPILEAVDLVTSWQAPRRSEAL